jgi:hypothetical protein
MHIKPDCERFYPFSCESVERKMESGLNLLREAVEAEL